MHPLRSLAALPLCVFVVAAACSGAPEEARCATLHRLASNDVQVMSLDPAAAAPVARAEGACAGIGCLRAEKEGVVVTQPDGALWAAWAGEKGRVVVNEEGARVGEMPENVGALADMMHAKNAQLRGVAPRAGAASTSTAPPVVLPPEYRTCGTTNAGGGLAFHVIQNDGSVWQRLHWTTPPTSDEVKALPQNAYPLAIGASGALCGYATQKTPRHWQVHTPSGVVVDAAPDREHPPAHCVNVDTVSIDAGEHTVRVTRDGTVKKTPTPADPLSPRGAALTADPTFPLDGQASSTRPVGTLRIADTAFSRPLEGKDLAGNPLPAGAHRRRVASAGDGARFVIVTERIELPDCTTRELVHLVDTDKNSVINVRDADVVINKLGAGADRFWWLEATPQLVDVGG